MGESIVKVPTDLTMDYDFIAFTFNGKHSYEDFGIIRTSDGDRYNDNLAPTMTDKTAEVPGGDGTYYFGTTHKQKDFNISFAFEHMTEQKYREMRRWLNGKEMGDLWFAEMPYKVYTAKVTGIPNIKTISFDEDGERIYKGEGSVTFTAYWPYAHTPDYVEYNGTKMNGKNTESYAQFSNYKELYDVEVLPGQGDYPMGDLPFYFELDLIPPNSTSTSEFNISETGVVTAKLNNVTTELDDADIKIILGGESNE